MCIVSLIREISVKRARYVYLIQIQWCSEFFTYVYVYWIRSGPEQKNAHAYLHTRAGTPCRATRVALHVSQQISSESWVFSSVAAVSRYTPPEKALSHLSPLNCQQCRTSGCLWKGVALQGGVAATLVGVALHCATKPPPPPGASDISDQTSTKDLCHFDILKRGCANSVVGLELADWSTPLTLFSVLIFFRKILVSVTWATPEPTHNKPIRQSQGC